MHRPDRRQALEWLVGPAGPELGCVECFAQIDRYVEVELGIGDPHRAVPGMAAHLVGCRACREDYESLRALVGSQEARQRARIVRSLKRVISEG